MTTANPHLRAIAIAGVLAAVALMLGSYTLSHRGGGTVGDVAPPALTHPTTTHPAAAHRAPAKHAVAKPKPATTTAAAHAAAKPKPVVEAKPKVAARPAGPPPVVQAALAYGLPKPVADQFAGHSVVVVSLYSPGAGVDLVTEGEAEAGAQLAGAGFAAIDTTRDGAAATLTKLLGVVDAPATLVFQAPPADATREFAVAKAAQPKPRYPAAADATAKAPDFKLFVKLTGYNDRQTVAQAAVNADPDPGTVAAQSPWAAAANRLCTAAASKVAAAGSVDSLAQLKKLLPVVKRQSAIFLAGLAKLAPPPGKAADVARFRSLTEQDMVLTQQLAAAVAKKDSPTTAMLIVKEQAVSRQEDAIALRLGATACVGGF